jgi:glycosyltransferase involved in cell wall biosynthesis
MFDDGSEDDTFAEAEAFVRSDSRFRIVGRERVGLVEALRRAVRASDAELLARIDGDDICRPGRLQKQVELLDAEKDLAAVGSLVNSFSSLGPVKQGIKRYTDWLNRKVSPEEIERALFVESPLCHPSVTMRREAYDRSCGYVDDGHPEDYRLWLDFYSRGFKTAKVPKVLLDWRDRPERLTRTDPRCGPDRFAALKLRCLLSTVLADKRRVCIWGAGKTGRCWSRRLTAAGVEVCEFIDIDPAKIGHSVHGRPVVSIPLRPSDVSADFLLVAVGADAVRRKIESYLTKIELPLEKWICVA